MIDLDGSLLLARANAAEWSALSAVNLAHKIGRSLGCVVDWDAGSGEDWVRVVSGDRVVAFVSVTLPLVIAESSVARVEVQYGSVLPIVVSDLDIPILSASRKALGDAFGESDRLNTIEVDRFSANDLWYATV